MVFTKKYWIRFGAMFLVILVGLFAGMLNAVSTMLWVHPHGARQVTDATDAMFLRMLIIIGIEFLLQIGWTVWFIVAAIRDARRVGETQAV